MSMRDSTDFLMTLMAISDILVVVCLLVMVVSASSNYLFSSANLAASSKVIVSDQTDETVEWLGCPVCQG